MAIYHLSAQIISRGAGRSVVAAQAYRAAEKIHDERLGKTFDFTRKSGVEHTEIMLPEVAPAWMRNRNKLWNAVEKLEKRKDAQLAREVQVALPKELSHERQVELAREFVKEHFVKHGMVADLAVHRDNPENPHAHITLGMREVTGEGFGKKNREWNSKGYLMGWRESWARCVNRELAHQGHIQRVDHRSYADQGIQLEPTSKLGARLENARTDGRDVVQERLQEHLETVRRNGEAILKEPRIALDAITYQQATFSKTEVGRWLNTRTVDAEQFNACIQKVMGSDELVSLGDDSRGRERFTTKEMLKIEKDLVADSKAMDQSQGHQVTGRFLDQAEATRTLTEEQKLAFRHIVERTGDMAVVEGYAGTGKSYLLGAAKEAWEAQGYRVLGASLAGKAAEGLELSSGIQSRSIHAWEYAWKKGYERLGGKDVLVIDEAGMVGARQMNRVVGKARAAGAKVVLVGDTEQLQAIEAGAPMRKIAEEIGQVTISEIRRQKEPWQRQATVDFATSKTEKGLDAYMQRGFIHEHKTERDALDSVVDAWDKFRKEHPEKTQIMLAFKRDDVREMNISARARRREDGELGLDRKVETERGERYFSIHDRIYFLKNDRSLGVKNGSLGTIEAIDRNSMQVRLDGPERKVVVFDYLDYNNIDHGYAATLHKCQGATVDRATVLASKLFDRHTAYVGMTRHTDQADLHWSREEFRDKRELYQTLCRERKKQMAVDFEEVQKDNERLSRLLEKGPANLSYEEKKRTRNYAQGDVVRFEKDYKRLGFQKGECAEIARVDYEYNTVHLRTQTGREVEWHPYMHARVEVFKEKELPEKQPEKVVEEKLDHSRPASRLLRSLEINSSDFDEAKGKEFNPADYLKEARARMKEREKTPEAWAEPSKAQVETFKDKKARIDMLRKARSDYLDAKQHAGDRPVTMEMVKEERPNIYDHYACELAEKWEELRLKANKDLPRLKPLFEQGEKEIPEVIVEKYENLEAIAKRDRVTGPEVHQQQPKVRKAKQLYDRSKDKFATAQERREVFEADHPLKAKMGMGGIKDLRENEREAGERKNKAYEAYEKTWKDPELQDMSGRQAKDYNDETERSKGLLKELKPDFEEAKEFLDKEWEHKWELRRERQLEKGLERGFGFDRGIGF